MPWRITWPNCCLPVGPSATTSRWTDMETAVAIADPAPRASWRDSDQLWSAIVLWQVLAWGPLDRYLPTPLSIVRALKHDWHLYPPNIRATLGLAVRGWI